jgi:hypothetical protein
MIEINLLPEDLRKKETVKISLPEIPIKKTLFIGVGSVLALQVLFTLFTFWLRFEDGSLNRQIAALKESGKEIQRQKSETTAVFNRLKEARAITGRKFTWAQVLANLTNSMTKGVWLRTMYVTNEEPKSSSAKPVQGAEEKKASGDTYLVLEGSAMGQGQETAFIGKFLKQLKDNPLFSDLFSDIKPFNINQRRIKDFDVYDFMIYCRFKKEKL